MLEKHKISLHLNLNQNIFLHHCSGHLARFQFQGMRGSSHSIATGSSRLVLQHSLSQGNQSWADTAPLGLDQLHQFNLRLGSIYNCNLVGLWIGGTSDYMEWN